MIFPTSRLVGCVIVPWRWYLKVFHHKGSNSCQFWYKVVAGSEQQKDTHDMDQDTSQDFTDGFSKPFDQSTQWLGSH